MTPMDYKDRYELIKVPLIYGLVKTVKVNMYRLAHTPANVYGGYNQAAAQAFLAKLDRNGIDTRLRVDTDAGTVYIDPDLNKAAAAHKKSMQDGMVYVYAKGKTLTMDSSAGGQLPLLGAPPSKLEMANDMHSLARYVFAGKGAPEHCQIVLQLAHYWGLAPQPQVYADAALGLDCNGFVGNYLWHDQRGNPWTDLGIRFRDKGPDAYINEFFPRHPGDFVAHWDDLDGSKMYVMGMVDGNGNIIPGGSAGVGHFTITQPGFARPPRTNGGVTAPAIYVVESTAGHKPGLWESYYSFVSVNSNRVFTVRREEMTVPYLNVKIAEVR
jgi:hypothetical protein